jgi:hypothetical protein
VIRTGLLLATLASSSAAWQTRMVDQARKYVGTPYLLGGRAPSKGLDCQGVIFLAAQSVRACSWKSYSVFPTQTVRTGELGAVVLTASAAGLDVAKLQFADVIMLLAETENPKEPSIATLEGRPQWVWHTGLYAGEGKWINADPFSGRVEESSLAEYVRSNGYTGIVATRMPRGPRPPRCR